jgi:hypothetical protein
MEALRNASPFLTLITTDTFIRRSFGLPLGGY